MASAHIDQGFVALMLIVLLNRNDTATKNAPYCCISWLPQADVLLSHICSFFSCYFLLPQADASLLFRFAHASARREEEKKEPEEKEELSMKDRTKEKRKRDQSTDW